MSEHTEVLRQVIDHAHCMALAAWRLEDRALAKEWSHVARKLARALERFETCEMVQGVAKKAAKPEETP